MIWLSNHWYLLIALACVVIVRSAYNLAFRSLPGRYTYSKHDKFRRYEE
jgi:hypothetical protein